MTFHRFVAGTLLLGGLAALRPAFAQKENPFKPEIPKVWDEQELATWATPIAGLNVRPGHLSEAEYYRAPIDNYRTYPVYAPGREPAGYWEMLQKIGPQPLIDTSKLQSKRDWIEAGKAVFEQADHLALRSLDPKVVAALRSPEMLKNLPYVSPDGTLRLLRWVPTEKGVAIGHVNCGSCHTREEPDGTRLNGPPARGEASSPIRSLVGRENVATSPFHISESLAEKMYRAFAAPWVKDDVHERLKHMAPDELVAWNESVMLAKGVIPRWNGSVFFPAKVPDLIGVAGRKYLDHTGTHANRGIGDLMRYAALVSYAESSEFGPHQMLAAEQPKIYGRLPDEAFYALALYIQSLRPPANPNPFDERARAGQQIFGREGCAGCHTPGLYTNNKLTLAQGFAPPAGNPAGLDVMAVSVGTDPNLALKTRKGTGYYKVPSLRGVWYRGHFLHDASVASLEEMFDPDRLKDTHQPGGWNPPGVHTRAVIGHEFGLRLTIEEKASLLAFLKTL